MKVQTNERRYPKRLELPVVNPADGSVGAGSQQEFVKFVSTGAREKIAPKGGAVESHWACVPERELKSERAAGPGPCRLVLAPQAGGDIAQATGVLTSLGDGQRIIAGVRGYEVTWGRHNVDNRLSTGPSSSTSDEDR